MARIFLTNIDMQNNQITNLVAEKLATDPATPATARIVYNTTSNKLEYWNGTAWVVLDNSNLNGQNAAYYLARANHTGTQAASTISDFDTQVRTSRLDQLAIPTAALNLNSQKITALATPTAATDAATKAYAEARANHTGTQLAATISDFATAADARVAAAGYATSIGNGTLTTLPVTHNLNTRDVIVQVYQVATPYAQVWPDIAATTVNAIDVTFAVAPTANQYRVLVRKAA